MTQLRILSAVFLFFLAPIVFAEPLADPGDRNPIPQPKVETASARTATFALEGASPVPAYQFPIRVTGEVPLAWQKRFYSPDVTYFCETREAELRVIAGDSHRDMKVADLRAGERFSTTLALQTPPSPTGYYFFYVKVKGRVLSTAPSDRAAVDDLVVHSDSMATSWIYRP